MRVCWTRHIYNTRGPEPQPPTANPRTPNPLSQPQPQKRDPRTQTPLSIVVGTGRDQVIQPCVPGGASSTTIIATFTITCLRFRSSVNKKIFCIHFSKRTSVRPNRRYRESNIFLRRYRQLSCKSIPYDHRHVHNHLFRVWDSVFFFEQFFLLFKTGQGFRLKVLGLRVGVWDLVRRHHDHRHVHNHL